MLAALCAAKASQQEAQQKERAACLQVKQAVQMVEEAKLCKAKVRFQEDLPNSSSQTVLFWPAFISRVCVCVCADGVAVWADVQRAGPTQAAVRAGTSGFAEATERSQRRGTDRGPQTERGAGIHCEPHCSGKSNVVCEKRVFVKHVLKGMLRCEWKTLTFWFFFNCMDVLGGQTIQGCCRVGRPVRQSSKRQAVTDKATWGNSLQTFQSGSSQKQGSLC